MNYLNPTELKNEMLKKIPISNIQERNELKKALVLTKLINLVIKNKENVFFFNGRPYFEEKTIKESLGSNFELKSKKIIKNNGNILRKYNEEKEFYFDLNRERKENNNIDKNKKIKKEGGHLVNKAQIKTKELKEVINSEGKNIIFDIELYEKTGKDLLEVGFVTFEKNEVKEVKHYIIKENYEKRNGKYVEDNKENFNFGNSEIVSEKEAVEELEKRLLNSKSILGHGIHGDLKYLKKNHEELYEKLRTKKVIDTALTTNTLCERNQQVSVGRVLNKFNIPNSGLHNAGNDAMYNFIILNKIVQHNDFILKNNKNKVKRKM